MKWWLILFMAVPLVSVNGQDLPIGDLGGTLKQVVGTVVAPVTGLTKGILGGDLGGVGGLGGSNQGGSNQGGNYQGGGNQAYEGYQQGGGIPQQPQQQPLPSLPVGNINDLTKTVPLKL